MKIHIAILSCGRPALLRLTTRWLLRSEPMAPIHIFDDSGGQPVSPSGGRLISGVLEEFRAEGVLVTVTRNKSGHTTDRRKLNARCANQRAKALDWFLGVSAIGDVLFVKDDDILVPFSTVEEAASDLEFMETTDYASTVACMSLHGPAGRIGGLWPGPRGGIFTDLKLSGESHVLFRRDALLAVGNHFDASKEKGFADIQWGVLMDSGWRYVTRTWPPYAVQHLGIGPHGSVIYGEAAHQPFWCAEMHQTVYHKRPVQLIGVPGFPVEEFREDALQVGGEEAARKLMEKRGESLWTFTSSPQASD